MNPLDTDRVIVWFSCGAASAVAAKVAVNTYGERCRVDVCYCDLSRDEHPDNARFLLDVERWIGRPIVRLSHPKFKSIDEVFLNVRYIAGVSGAACTRRLKRQVQEAYATSDDFRVLGMTSDERHRINRLVERFPDEKFLWLLADAGITKEDCYHVLTAAGIELPAMYRLGYDHNNCIGCVKGGKGYWNKIRRDFPEVFARRAKIEREIGFPILRDTWLDELDPEAGRDVKEPNIECGIFCDQYARLVDINIPHKDPA